MKYRLFKLVVEKHLEVLVFLRPQELSGRACYQADGLVVKAPTVANPSNGQLAAFSLTLSSLVS